MLPIHRLEDDLVGLVTIEDERCMVAMWTRRFENVDSNPTVEQPPDEHVAPRRPFDGATADDERDRRRQRLRNWFGKGIASTGHQSHVNARVDSVTNGVTIGGRKVPATIEERAVYVYADQPDHATFISRFYA